jgi:hypothetical protein
MIRRWLGQAGPAFFRAHVRYAAMATSSDFGRHRFTDSFKVITAATLPSAKLLS